VRSLGLRKPNLYYTAVPFPEYKRGAHCRLAGLASVQEVSDGTGLHLTSTSLRCWLDVDTTIAQSHLEQLTAQVGEQTQRLAQLRGRLENANYVKHAPKRL
jgi:hypothetical protein